MDRNDDAEEEKEQDIVYPLGGTMATNQHRVYHDDGSSDEHDHYLTASLVSLDTAV